ncbi:MAG: DNA polymerase (family 10) [Saprospiraceae bacterium]|jgi:DNA polymerase (family 10)
MSNKEIAKTFQFLGAIMELHGDNPFKIKSYNSAYITLRKLQTPLVEIPTSELSDIKGVGKSTSGKITELLTTGKMEALEKLKAKTPPGVQEMLQIKGFGPKKIRTIWKEMEVESIGELLYACNENRLVELKGFGKKTQDDLIAKLKYFLKSRNSFHYAALESDAENVIKYLENLLPGTEISLTGAMRRRANIVDSIEILVGTVNDEMIAFDEEILTKVKEEEHVLYAKSAGEYPVIIYLCQPKEFGSKLFVRTAAKDFMDAFVDENKGVDFKGLATEEAVFAKANLPYIEPELREQDWAIQLAKENRLPVLLEEKDIKGVVHSHTTYSDGLHTLEEMATYSKSLGFEYIVITDHSQAAFYANGLKPDRVAAQMAEIDELNKKLAPFRIFKSIECDILNDGRLDYDEETLSKFDCIIASVHTNLRMDKEKATERLLTAIRNPLTTVLGHPTGRLLLSREGYPIDYEAIIDACAEHNVIIELNANPYRLDLDWTWIPYALEKGVKISVNPDAHSMGGIHDIRYGTLSARKGGLTKEMCFNSMGLVEMEKYLGMGGIEA